MEDQLQFGAIRQFPKTHSPAGPKPTRLIESLSSWKVFLIRRVASHRDRQSSPVTETTFVVVSS